MESKLKAKKHKRMIVRGSPIDRFTKENPVSVIFFYQNSIDDHTLKNSLSEVLSDFPVFAGSLRHEKDEIYINCDNEGVVFSIENHTKTSSQVFSGLFEPKQRKELISDIDVKKAIKGKEALLNIRINYFSDGGMAIGITWHHYVGDMHSFMLLMTAWSNHTRGEKYQKPLIVEDRKKYLHKQIKDNRNNKKGIKLLNLWRILEITSYMVFKANNLQLVPLYFTNAELENARKKLSEKSGISLSINDTLSALIFSSISQLNPRKKGRPLGITINFRTRCGLPNSLLGNNIAILTMDVAQDELVEDVAKKIRQHLSDFTDKHMDYYANLRFIEKIGGEKKIDNCLLNVLDPVKGGALITSWRKFGAYDIDFGTGKPFFFTEYEEPDSPCLHVIMDGFNNNGVIYNTVLPEKLARRFTERENLDAIHQYRDPSEKLPELVQSLDWIH